MSATPRTALEPPCLAIRVSKRRRNRGSAALPCSREPAKPPRPVDQMLCRSAHAVAHIPAHPGRQFLPAQTSFVILVLKPCLPVHSDLKTLERVDRKRGRE